MNRVCYLMLSSDNWQLLNWLFSYINEKSDYRATAKDYLNIGNSMISKLLIGVFDSEETAREYINLVFAYYGKDKNSIKINYILEDY